MTETEIAQENERMRNGITDMLKRVPHKVNAGSYQTAVEFKRAAKKAQAVIAKPRLDHLKLKAAHNELAVFYP